MGHWLSAVTVSSTLQLMTPILLAALGGALCAQVGLFNVALEGFMLMGAFFAVLGDHLTNSPVLGLLTAIVASAAYALILALLTIRFRANEIVVGTALNFLSLALTTFMLSAVLGATGSYYDNTMQGLPLWNIPVIAQIPFLSWLSGYTPLVYLGIILVMIQYVFLYKTPLGVHFLYVGVNRTAAASLGIRPHRVQAIALVISGVMCGLAGAQLSIGDLTGFAQGMTSGRGFIALVAVMLGRSNPFGVLGASVLFGLMDVIATELQGFMPTQFAEMVPYVVTLLALFVFKKRFTTNSETFGL